MSDLQKLYDVVSSNFDIGTYDEFKSKMQTPEDRKRFYDVVRKNGFDLGDYEAYENRLKKKEDGGGFRTVAKFGEQTELEKQGVGTIIDEETPEKAAAREKISQEVPGFPVDDTMDFTDDTKLLEYQAEEKKQAAADQKYYTESYSELIKNQLSTLNESISSKENDWYDKKAIASGDWQPITPEDFQDAERLKDISVDKLENDLSRQRKVKSIYEDAQKYIETKDDGFLQSLVNNFDDDILTMGMSSVIDNFDLVGIARRYNKDPESISDSEKEALIAYGVLSDVQEKIKQGRGAEVGGMVMESIPFIAQFLLGGGIATTAAKATVKKSLKVGLSKGMTKLLAGTASTIARTSTLAPMIAGNVENRMTGNIDVEIEDGQAVPIIREGTQEGLGEALGKSWVQAFTAVASEGLGELAAPAQSYLLKKVGLSKIDDYMKAMGKTEARRIMKQAQINGIPTEFGEEVANKYLDKILINEGSWGFEEDELLNTLLTVVAINGAGSVAGTTQMAAEKIKSIKEEKNTAQRNLIPQTRIDVDKILDQDVPVEVKGKELNDYISKKVDEGASREQVKSLVDYAQKKEVVNTVNDIQKIKSETKPEVVKEEVTTPQVKEETVKTTELTKEEQQKQGLKELGTETYEPEKVTVQNTSEGKLTGIVGKMYGKDTKKYDVNYGGEKVGQIETAENENEVTYMNISLDKGRGVGIGKDMLRNLNNQVSQQGKVLVSTPTKLESSERVWESLVKSGEAVKMDDGRFKMNPVEQPSEVEIKTETTTPQEKPIESKQSQEKVEGKKIEPAKEVKANKTIAIKEVIEGKDIKEMEAGFLLNKYGKGESIDEFEEGLSKTMQDKLDEKGYIEYKNDFKYGLTDAGKDLIKSINARIETRKNVKSGTDLFPENANIPELKTKEEPTNAIQEPSTEKVYVRKTPEDSKEVGERDKGQPGEKEKLPKKEKVSDEVNKISFDFMGETITGEVVEQGKNIVKIKDKTGTIHTITPNTTIYKNIKGVPFETKSKAAVLDDVKKKIKEESEGKVKESSIFSLNKIGKKKEDVHDNFKRVFKKEKGLPPSVFSMNKRKQGAVNSTLYKANNIAKDAIKQAKKSFGVKKLTEEQSSLMMDVLENMGTKRETREKQLSRLPEDIRPHVELMRDQIDKLSSDIKKTGILNEGNELKFDENTGFYLTRAYRKHTDPKYTWETIPDEVKEKAAETLQEYYPDATPDKIMGILKNIVDDKSFTSFISPEQPLGKMDLGITKKRSQFLTDNPAIRDLMGEIRDPFTAYAISVAKMTELAERAKFLNNVTELGLKEGWLKEDIEGEYRKPIGVDKLIGFNVNKPTSPKGSKSLSPLNEYYTTPTIANAFETFNDANVITNKIIKAYMNAVTATKLANTAFSIGSQVRNFQSNGINLLANGAWNVWQTVPEIKNKLKTKESKREFIAELKKNNIIGDNVETQAMIKNIEQLSGYMDRLYTSDPKAVKALKDTRKLFLDMYQMGDDVFKAYRYVSEYTRYDEVYKKQGKENHLELAKDKAKDILHDTQTYYSNVPKFMDTLRVLPVSGTFITFPYLTTINLYNTAKLSVEEMKNADTFHIGLQRASGMMAGVSGLAIMAMMVNRGNGMDDDDMNDIRRALPDYWKNDIITVKESMGDGKFKYSNTSYLDFYNGVTTPVLSLVHAYAEKGNVDIEDFVHSVGIFLEPYTDTDILFQRTINVLNNWDNELKRPVYNESLPDSKKLLVISEYLGSTVVPSTLRDIKRATEISKRGQDAKSFLFGRLTGRQTRELDLAKSFSLYNFPITKQKIEDAAGIYNQVKNDKGKSDAEKAESLELANKQINHYISELHKDYMAFRRQGASNDELLLALNQNYGGYQMNSTLKNAVINGTEVIIDKTGEVLDKGQYELFMDIRNKYKGKDFMDNESKILDDMYVKMFGDVPYKSLTAAQKNKLNLADKKLKMMFMNDDNLLFEKEVDKLLYGSNDDKVKKIIKYQKENGAEKTEELIRYMDDWNMLSDDLYYKLYDEFEFMRKPETEKDNK